MKVNDLVYRKSHGKDILFQIKSINNNIAVLEGYNSRLVADSPMNDLVLANYREVDMTNIDDNNKLEKIFHTFNSQKKHITGRILHIDGDRRYLDKCLRLYKRLNLDAYGFFINIEDLESKILDILKNIKPEILIITGHDSYNKKGNYDLNNYTHSKYYVNTLDTIRKHYSKNDLVIFAGACQSNFEALIYSGANFASSPNRVNIDAYDPAIIAIKAATTSISKIIDIKDIYDYIKTKGKGISGIESYGKMRLLYE